MAGVCLYVCVRVCVCLPSRPPSASVHILTIFPALSLSLQVFEDVCRVGQALVEHCSMGSTRYLEFHKDYNCFIPDASGCAHVIRELEQNATQLERDLKDWKNEMKRCREEDFYQLNFFTMRQMLLLRRELCTLACSHTDITEEIPNQVITLLAVLKPDVTADDIVSVVRCGMASQEEKGIIQTAPAHRSTATRTATFGTSFSSINEFTLENEFDSLRSNVSPLSCSAYSPSRSAKNQEKFLDLSQLGQILFALHKRTKAKPTCIVPEYISKGKPNLLVVPESDVLGTVLDLYRHDESSSLPTASEVLVCTPETTAEEVILLWWRAVFSKHLHCLVHADRLDYTVSSLVIKELLRLLDTVHQQGHSCDEFALVVICRSENEDHTWIMSALEEFRRLATPCSPKEVRRYLMDKFLELSAKATKRSGSCLWHSAARMDHEESCVRVVTSERAGVGKSLYIEQLAAKVASLDVNQRQARRNPGARFMHTIPLQGNAVSVTGVMDMFMHLVPGPSEHTSRLFHIDVARTVQSGLDTFLFNLLVLGSVSDHIGRTWQRAPHDLYVVEVTSDEATFSFLRAETGFMEASTGALSTSKQPFTIVNQQLPFLTLLPARLCGSPLQAYEALASLEGGVVQTSSHPTLDHSQLMSEPFQRVFGYLSRQEQQQSLDTYNYDPEQPVNDPKLCLQLLLSKCGVMNPSWLVLHHFVHFLNAQLTDCEKSVFCDMKLVGEELPGFRAFVVRFLLNMAVDFATPSIDVADDVRDAAEEELPLVLRRRWEQCPHPYLFFNSDRVSLTFVGFNVDSDGNLLDQNGTMLERNIMQSRLVKDLKRQRVNLQEDFNSWNRARRLECLCKVLGQEYIQEVDESYELTLDNVKKILAIQMRFRCGIPVVVMGETGCGKTRLIRFMCNLQAGSEDITNMLIMKIHGGTTEEHIIKMVTKAESLADVNSQRQHPIDTVLFFDEANTSNALGMIKEVMCDRRINGRAIADNIRLRFIAACNPYRRHTAEMIRRLEEAGLGYHVRSTETEDKLGRIPLRQLVYRVHPLPGKHHYQPHSYLFNGFLCIGALVCLSLEKKILFLFYDCRFGISRWFRERFGMFRSLSLLSYTIRFFI